MLIEYEHQPYKLEIVGANPTFPTNYFIMVGRTALPNATFQVLNQAVVRYPGFLIRQSKQIKI